MGSSMKQPKSAHTQIPSYLMNVSDYQKEAELHMTTPVWSYLEGGAADEVSIKENLEQFSKFRLIPRPLRDFEHANTACEIFGQSYPHPIFLSPIGHQQQFHADAELATALAAEVLGSNFVLSNFSNTDLRHFNKENPFKWFQMYWQGNREYALELIKLAETQNFKAIVLTVDAPHPGIRDRERHALYQTESNNTLPHIRIEIPKLNSDQHELFQGLMRIAPKWADIEWLVQQTDLPILLKGISHQDDALCALAKGIRGLVISNHGGRVLDTCISPLIALQKIKKIVPSDFPLIYDGGIRRGSDVFKAIALGASAVCIGRPYIYGLAVAGALGVAHVIKILKEEFEITMALMGTACINEINTEYLSQDRFIL